MIRPILNYLGETIGELELPDDTPEETWTEKLALFAIAPPTSGELQASFVAHTIKERKEYADGLIERFKARNISQGINALQGMWMHHRMRANEITFMGVPFTIDVLNLVISGDIEIACLVLLNTTPDDDSLPYHWLTSDRVNWLIADMKGYLGWT